MNCKRLRALRAVAEDLFLGCTLAAVMYIFMSVAVAMPL
jgi:hypothetical protein